MMRRLPGACILACLTLSALPMAAGLAVTTSPTATRHSTTVSRTTVVRLRPVTASGQLRAGYKVTHRHGGASCQAGSEATGNAYRCFADFVYDPCWVSANKAFVDCLEQPYSHKVARLHVTKGYDNEGGLGRSSKTPWGLQVAGGKRATFLQGASGAVGGRRINYLQKGFTLVLIGNVDKLHAVWRIREARRTHGHYKVIGWVDLSTAWFGKPSRKA